MKANEFAAWIEGYFAAIGFDKPDVDLIVQKAKSIEAETTTINPWTIPIGTPIPNSPATWWYSTSENTEENGTSIDWTFTKEV